MFTWLYDSWVWLTGPSVRPMFGALAAIVAALTIDPANWLRPLRALRRALQVVIVWLVAIWLFGMIPFANGEGYGWEGGRGSGGTGKERGSGPGEVKGDRPSRPGVTVLGGTFPSGLAENVLVQVQFVPLATDPLTPREYACDVLVREGGKNVQIRAGSMRQFEEDLVAVLREVVVPETLRQPVASVKRTPNPGEGTLRRVEGAIRRTLPGLGLQRDE